MPFLALEPAAGRDAKIRVVAKMLAENLTAHSAATYLLAQDRLDFLAVRYPAMAQLRHDFSSAVDTPAGQGAAWQCLHLLDAFLAWLIELAGSDAFVVVTGGTASAPCWIAHGAGVAPDLLWGPTTSLYDVAPSLPRADHGARRRVTRRSQVRGARWRACDAAKQGAGTDDRTAPFPALLCAGRGGAAGGPPRPGGRILFCGARIAARRPSGTAGAIPVSLGRMMVQRCPVWLPGFFLTAETDHQ